MKVRGFGLFLIATVTGAPLTRAATDLPRPLIPIAPHAVLRGTHLSSCAPMNLRGERRYTRLALRFDGKKYASTETLYSDPKCEVSVLQTNSQGFWQITNGTVLNLKLARMQMRPLDPRIADRLSAAGACGAAWENGVSREILGTSCGRGNEADYFVGQSPSGKSLRLYECEGRGAITASCTHYAMAAESAAYRPAKSAKTRVSPAHFRN